MSDSGDRDESFRQLPPGSGGNARSGMDTSAVAALLLMVPWFVWSLGVVALISGLLSEDPPWQWLIIGLWILSGAVTFWRPIEDFIARALFRLRRPTMRDSEKLDAAWRAVAHQAGIEPAKYSLLIDETGDVNAPALGGRTISVTRWSLSTLPAKQLEGIVAHELGHHLRGRSWAHSVGLWYSLPGRGTVWLIHTIGQAMRAVPMLGCLISSFFALVVASMLFSAWIFSDFPVQLFALVLILFAPIILAGFDRLAEKNADRVAAQIGYGPAVLEALYLWQAHERDVERRGGGRQAAWLASHPPVADRIRSLESYLRQRAE